MVRLGGCTTLLAFCFYSLTFCYNPPSSVYGYTTHNLKPNGSEIPVTVENAEEYIKQVTDFCLHSGIKKQMEAFKGTLSLVNTFFAPIIFISVLWIELIFLNRDRRLIICMSVEERGCQEGLKAITWKVHPKLYLYEQSFAVNSYWESFRVWV